MLHVTGLTKVYGDKTIFEEVSFSLRPGERLGIVGRNGCGKSSLFRLILGEEHPDEGEITMPKGYKVGHLAQHLEFTEPTIIREVCLGLPEDERDQEYRGEIILNGLGFSDDDMQKAPSEFSGGFQIRLNLAKLLLSEPNLLLLDEPTNYLDIVSVRWLTGFLRAWRNELIIITHDRLFMDAVTTDTMAIHRSAIRKMPGGSQKVLDQIKQDEILYEKSRLNDEKRRKELEEFINRFRAQAAKAALVQSKIKMLERLGKKDELMDESSLEFRFCEAAFPGKLMLEAKDLTFSYPGGPTLIQDLNLAIGKRDRIAIIGKNGKGKSTLLKLLAGELTPNGGTVEMSQNARLGYFGQTNISRLDPKLTVEAEIENANRQHHRTIVRAICGTMMFSGDDALKKIGVLSGGEKSRVLLGKILAQPANLLLLDEPTNHLDVESIEALLHSLRNYDGAVVVVTHSELLLKDLATRLVIFRGEVPEVFEHDYQYFLQKIGWDDDGTEAPSKARVEAKREEPKKEPPKDLAKVLRPLERKVTELEEKIVKLEAELKATQEKLVSTQDAKEISALSNKFKDTQDAIERNFTELERVSMELEEKRKG
jgi:ATP-binding cassette subfamily F protein 3